MPAGLWGAVLCGQRFHFYYLGGCCSKSMSLHVSANFFLPGCSVSCLWAGAVGRPRGWQTAALSLLGGVAVKQAGWRSPWEPGC